MGMFRAMRDELFKYRKRKQKLLDGSVPGAPYVHYRRSRRHVSGSFPSFGGSYQHDLYNCGLPRDYHPNVHGHSGAFDDYDPDTDWESHQVMRHPSERVMRPFPECESCEAPPDFDQIGELDEFFLKIEENQYRMREEGEVVPSVADMWDEFCSESHQDDESDSADAGMHVDRDLDVKGWSGLPDEEDVQDALGRLRQSLPEDHPDIARLSAVADILGYQAMELDVMDDGSPAIETDAEISSYDPFAVAEQGLDAQEGGLEVLLNGFDADGIGGLEQLVMEPDEGTFEPDFGVDIGCMEAFEPDDGFGEGFGLMAGNQDAAAEINQAIDQAAQQPLAEEEDPFDTDPFAVAADCFEQQFQYMADPFMTGGGAGPMPGPEAIPGFGPMPGP